MAFSDYKTLAQVQQRFTITYGEAPYILDHEAVVPAPFLAEMLFNRDYLDVYSSEAARCEALIFPILREVYKTYAEHCELWIQKSLAYDADLNGTPDYMLATRSTLGKTVFGEPVLIIVEAKRNDFEQGWGQCLAAMVAAQKLNRDLSTEVHGIVTDGLLWRFGKLIAAQFMESATIYTAHDLPALFGALHFVMQASLDAVSATASGG
jgi:hypothetical protein